MISDTSGQDVSISKHKNKSKLWFGIGVVLIIGIFLIVLTPTITRWQQGVFTVKSQRVTTGTVIRGNLVKDVAVSGRLVAANAPQLYSTESGVVSLNVKTGDVVTQGQVLARISSPELISQISQAQAQLESLQLDAKRGQLEDKEAALDFSKSLDDANVQLIAAKREKQRADDSFDKKVISEFEWVKANDVLLEANLLFEHAQKKVEIAKERLDFENQNRQNQVRQHALVLDELKRRVAALDVQAPIDGVVGNWLVEQKEQVLASTPLMTVVDLSQYEAQLDVPEFYADDLGLGLHVMLQINGKSIQAEIVSVSPEIIANQVSVKARLPDEIDSGLRQNQRVNARIEFERKDNVLMVKRGAFYQSGAGTAVYVLEDNNLAVKSPITTGVVSVEFVEILEGLTVGEKIITSDYSTFIENDVIRITPNQLSKN